MHMYMCVHVRVYEFVLIRMDKIEISYCNISCRFEWSKAEEIEELTNYVLNIEHKKKLQVIHEYMRVVRFYRRGGIPTGFKILEVRKTRPRRN